MTHTQILLSVLAFFLINLNLNAQVTIGSGEPPVTGAMLQLKEDNSNAANSTKGLLLPRLQLTGHNLDPIETSPSESADMYAGLTVWNIRGIQDICRGVNVWSGTKWLSLAPMPEDKTNYDPITGILTDHEGNTYTTSEFGSAGRWMTVNLRTRRAPGSCADVFFLNEMTQDQWDNNLNTQVMVYPNSDSNTITPATWTKEEGMFYSWSLATNGKGGPNGRGNVDNPGGANIDEGSVQAVQRQGICPTGWHLPSAKEWNDLLAVLQNDAMTNTDNYANYTQPNSGARGGITTIKTNTIINSIIPYGASKPSTDGGFNALLLGYGSWGSTAYTYGKGAYFWTASSSDLDVLAYLEFFLPENTTHAWGGSAQKNFLYSVRCKKNE